MNTPSSVPKIRPTRKKRPASSRSCSPTSTDTRANRNARRIYALADYTVERRTTGWYYGRTSRFGDQHTMKGPYSTERSVALMIARELIKEIQKRDSQHRLPA